MTSEVRPLDPAIKPAAVEGELTEQLVRDCYEHFMHHAEAPCSASAMREAIEKAIASIREADVGRLSWQLIETAPEKDGARILAAFMPRGRVDIVTWDAGGSPPYWRSHIMETVNGSRHMKANQPTHWMPLPNAPA